jgi:transcriptional regulator with XRE-family HTH domain
VTFAIPPTSVRYQAAQRFGRELDRAMRSRGIGRRRLAELLGSKSDSMISHWRGGSGIPPIAMGVRLAEILQAPELLAIVRQGREGRCALATCGKTYIHDGGGPKRYCSERCRVLATKVRVEPTRVRADVAERALATHRAAVAVMCRTCEPGGICHAPVCPLRSVSPFGLVVLPKPEDTGTPALGPYGSAENTAKTVAGIREGNARRWARPGEREKQSAMTKRLHKEGRIPPRGSKAIKAPE